MTEGITVAITVIITAIVGGCCYFVFKFLSKKKIQSPSIKGSGNAQLNINESITAGGNVKIEQINYESPINKEVIVDVLENISKVIEDKKKKLDDIQESVYLLKPKRDKEN